MFKGLKFTIGQARKAQSGRRFIAFNLGVRYGGWLRNAPAALTPEREPMPIIQEAGRSLGPLWMGAKNLAPPGFDPGTVQPIARRHTDYAIPAHEYSQI